MTGVLVIVGTIYGLTALAGLGAGVAWLGSPSFRRSIAGDNRNY